MVLAAFRTQALLRSSPFAYLNHLCFAYLYLFARVHRPNSPLMASKLKSLLSYQDIPKWQQSNRYLLSGYRYVVSRLRSHQPAASNLAHIPNPLIAFSPPSGSALASLASAFYLNNETINIHSHLAGGFVFALLPIYFQLASDPPLADAIVVTIFLEGVAICFLLSALQVFSSLATEIGGCFVV